MDSNPPSFDDQVDVFIPEEHPTSPISARPLTANPDRDSIARDKERLQRFHKEAMSFLTKAYSNDDTVLIEDRFDSAAGTRLSDDYLAQRRVELDRIRLERFHAQAVSFLDRAYADEPGTIVEEEQPLSPRSAAAVSPDREMLQKFHEEAMNFLDAAAGGTATEEKGVQRVGSGLPRRRADRTSVRIERDKARLEQHYQDAMSFLHRAEAEKKGVLIEEQELELAVVERFKLQKYAQDAMSFLDKAFRNDSSVMVGDDDDPSVDGHIVEEGVVQQEGNGVIQDVLDEDAATGKRQPVGDAVDQPLQGDEDRQIAADRAALERYDEEFGDFLSKAYLDDSTVIVEDADSETSGTERGLFARRMAQSTTSAETGDTGYSGSGTLDDDDFSEDAYTDDEFQDPSVAESSQLDILRHSLPTETPRPSGAFPESSVDHLDEDRENLRSRLMQYEREAADYLDGTNVSVDDEDYEDDVDGEYPRPEIPAGQENQRVTNRNDGADIEDGAGHVLVEEDDDDDEEFGVDRHIDDESIPRAFYDDEDRVSGSKQSSHSDFEVRSSQFPDRIKMPQRNSSRERRIGSAMDAKDFLVDVILEDNTGQSRELSQVPLERSFYRQIPRGSTVKLRPFVSPEVASSGQVEGRGTDQYTETVSVSELQRVEKERDVLMATLEEIVNERSMLAAQVGEMKSMVQNAGGAKPNSQSKPEEIEDIDLAAELKDAHETMSKLTEEMEATLGVLDNRYQETLERAHKAEEKCIRLESNGSKLEKEFSKQGARLSQALIEESRLSLLLSKSDRDLELARRKAESDLKKQDESHREELDRSVLKILELTNLVSDLQERVKGSNSLASAERKFKAETRKLEFEVGDLKQQLEEMERELTDERIGSKRRVENELEKARLERDRDVQQLTTKVERLQRGASEGEAAKKGLEKAQKDAAGATNRSKELEHVVDELSRELRSAKRGLVTAEAEAQHVRARYEESLNRRLAQMDQNVEMREMQAGLDHLKEEAGAREKRLQRQLEEFRSRAEQAENAAGQAERDAKAAADAAKLAQERGREAVEKERSARRAVEAEKLVVVRECKEWERFAQMKVEGGGKGELGRSDDSSGGLGKSSSKRGIRRSAERVGVGRKRGEEGGRRKGALRPRFFGN